MIFIGMALNNGEWDERKQISNEPKMIWITWKPSTGKISVYEPFALELKKESGNIVVHWVSSLSTTSSLTWRPMHSVTSLVRWLSRSFPNFMIIRIILFEYASWSISRYSWTWNSRVYGSYHVIPGLETPVYMAHGRENLHIDQSRYLTSHFV